MAKQVAREFKASDGSVELLLTEAITQETGTRLLAQLAALKGHPITLTIFSGGGDAHAAFAIHDYIKDEKNGIDVEVRVYGIAASGAMIIAAAAKKAYIGKGAFANIHNAFSTADELSANDRAVIDAMNDRQVDLFASRTGKRKDAVKKLMEKDELLSADEAVAFGLFDDTIEEAKVAALFNSGTMTNTKTKHKVLVKLSPGDAFKAGTSGVEHEVEIDMDAVAKTAIAALEADIAAKTTELAALKTAKDEADAAKVAADTEKAAAEATKTTVEAELVSAKAETAKYVAALEKLKKDPLVAQVMPDGTSVVIPGGTPAPDKNPNLTDEDKRLQGVSNAWEAAKKEYLKIA